MTWQPLGRFLGEAEGLVDACDISGMSMWEMKGVLTRTGHSEAGTTLAQPHALSTAVSFPWQGAIHVGFAGAH